MRRRDLFAATLVAGLAAPAAARGQDRDAAILRRLIAREDAAALAYSESAAAAQDEAHAKALRVELQGLIRPGIPRVKPENLDPAARELSEAVGAERRAAARALETELLIEYHEAVLTLSEPAILQAVATILACHAQRRALLGAGSYPP